MNKGHVAWSCNNNNIAFGDLHALAHVPEPRRNLALTTIFYIKNLCSVVRECGREAVCEGKGFWQRAANPQGKSSRPANFRTSSLSFGYVFSSAVRAAVLDTVWFGPDDLAKDAKSR